MYHIIPSVFNAIESCCCPSVLIVMKEKILRKIEAPPSKTLIISFWTEIFLPWESKSHLHMYFK